MPAPFRIKICGITNIADGRHAAAVGADAIGLNFYAPSPRSITIEHAVELGEELPDGLTRVGVFVNHSIEDIRRIASAARLDWIQLHGDETPEFMTYFPDHRVIRAFRCSSQNVGAALAWLDETERLGRLPAAMLVDAFQPGQFGGTGKTVDAAVIAQLRNARPELPLLLAGGLTPDNVASLIQAHRPDGVDTASGVEASPGKKDRELVERFVRLASEALSAH
jgi:phosphoribosylanthranilate isomerase